MVETRFAPEFVNIGAESRITIPQAYCERILWVCGDQIMRVWLLQLVPGRFRLLSDLAVEQNQKLLGLRAAIINGPDETAADATALESGELAALIGRLIPTTLSPPRPAWRLLVPKHIVPDDRNKRTLVLLFSLGYLEIWYLDTYNTALSSSLDLVI